MRWSAFLLLFVIAVPAAAEPADQRAFGDVVNSWDLRWQQANELRRAELPVDRGADLRRALKGASAFTDWEMDVLDVGVDKFGHAWIALRQPGAGVVPFVFTNATSSVDDLLGQRLPLGSPIYAVARTLNRGDRVIASGVLFADADNGFLDFGQALKVSLAQRFQYPQFAVRYTAMRR